MDVANGGCVGDREAALGVTEKVQLLKFVAWALLPEFYLRTRLLTGEIANPTTRDRPRHNTVKTL